MHLAAGGGLVLDSICEEEYKECFVEIRAIVDACQQVSSTCNIG